MNLAPKFSNEIWRQNSLLQMRSLRVRFAKGFLETTIKNPGESSKIQTIQKQIRIIYAST